MIMNADSPCDTYINENARIVQQVLDDLGELLQKVESRSEEHERIWKTVNEIQEDLNVVKILLQEETEDTNIAAHDIRNCIAESTKYLEHLDTRAEQGKSSKVYLPSYSKFSKLFRKYHRMKKKNWRKKVNKLEQLSKSIINDAPRPWENIEFHFDTGDHSDHSEDVTKGSPRRDRLSSKTRPCETVTSGYDEAEVENENFAQFLEEEAEKLVLEGVGNRKSAPCTATRPPLQKKVRSEINESPKTGKRNPKDTSTNECRDAKHGNSAEPNEESRRNSPEVEIIMGPSNSDRTRTIHTAGTNILQEINFNVQDQPSDSIASVSEPAASIYDGPRLETFEAMQLLDGVVNGMHCGSIISPTPLQQQLIPCLLGGDDTIVAAFPESGKTTAAIIYALQKINCAVKQPQVLYITSSPASAVEAVSTLNQIGTWMDLTASSCSKLESRPISSHIFVECVNRIRELIVERHLPLEHVGIIIVDSADVVMGASSLLVGKVLSFHLRPEQLQLVLLASKMTPEIASFSRKMKNPKYIHFSQELVPFTAVSVRPESPELEIIYSSFDMTTNSNMHDLNSVAQLYEVLAHDDVKIEVLRELSDLLEKDQAIIFCNSCEKADWLACKIRECHRDLEVCSVHGNCGNKDYLVDLFVGGVSRVLITTDFITQWNVNLIPVPVVFNYEFPENPEIYMQRITYAGQATKPAEVESPKVVMMSFVTESDLVSLKNLASKYGFHVQSMRAR